MFKVYSGMEQAHVVCVWGRMHMRYDVAINRNSLAG